MRRLRSRPLGEGVRFLNGVGYEKRGVPAGMVWGMRRGEFLKGGMGVLDPIEGGIFFNENTIVNCNSKHDSSHLVRISDSIRLGCSTTRVLVVLVSWKRVLRVLFTIL